MQRRISIIWEANARPNNAKRRASLALWWTDAVSSHNISKTTHCPCSRIYDAIFIITVPIQQEEEGDNTVRHHW